MEKKQPNPAPTRAQIKNRILRECFVTLFNAFIPKGERGKVAGKKGVTNTTTKKKKRPGYSGRGTRGGSRSVAAAASTPVSSCYASDGDSNA